MAAFHRLNGTLLGFGVFDIPHVQDLARVQYLTAMERFALGHEYGHFVAEERIPDFRGTLAPDQAWRLEEFCDQFSMAVNRPLADRDQNFPAFCGVGAVILFTATELCRTQHLMGGSTGGESTHPPAERRVRLLRAFIDATSASDQRESVLGFFDECDMIGRVGRELVGDFLMSAGLP
jgi:hypothetical protein